MRRSTRWRNSRRKKIFAVDALVTDQSSLWDFRGFADDADSFSCAARQRESKQDIFDRIKEAYGVDVSDITDGNLVAVLTRIQGD